MCFGLAIDENRSDCYHNAKQWVARSIGNRLQYQCRSDVGADSLDSRFLYSSEPVLPSGRLFRKTIHASRSHSLKQAPPPNVPTYECAHRVRPQLTGDLH
jgi:hypothetical protein